MEKRQHIIQHPSELNSLSTLPFTRRRAGRGRIALSNTFRHQDKAKWEQRLNRDYYACGCNEGAKGLLLGLVIFGGFALLNYLDADWMVSRSLTTFGIGVIGMSIFGKLVGLFRADMRLKRTVREIQEEWKPEQTEIKSEVIGCG